MELSTIINSIISFRNKSIIYHFLLLIVCALILILSNSHETMVIILALVCLAFIARLVLYVKEKIEYNRIITGIFCDVADKGIRLRLYSGKTIEFRPKTTLKSTINGSIILNDFSGDYAMIYRDNNYDGIFFFLIHNECENRNELSSLPKVEINKLNKRYYRIK